MQQESSTYTIDADYIKGIIKPRPVEGHKGTFGHALIIAGSEGKTGAAILAAKAALRTGCGLVSVHTITTAIIPLMCHLPEAMILERNTEGENDYPDLSKFRAIGFGPGAGLGKSSALLLDFLLKNQQIPLLIDADGITVLSQNKDWYKRLKPSTILTPHPKEFDRLTQVHETKEDRYISQLNFSKMHQVIVVLKGYRTVITLPNGNTYINSTGNNGMATAGSGDVLSGIMTALCAQGYESSDAAQLGIYLHGYAGDIAAHRLSRTSMIASDIIDGIPDFFKQFEQNI